jgi:hypothetical protein
MCSGQIQFLLLVSGSCLSVTPALFTLRQTLSLGRPERFQQYLETPDELFL